MSDDDEDYEEDDYDQGYESHDEGGYKGDDRCPNKHKLNAFLTPTEGFSCDNCGEPQDEGVVMHGCRICNYDVCQRCGSFPDIEDDSHKSPEALFEAIGNQDWDAVEELLSARNADQLQYKDDTGASVLHAAVSAGASSELLEKLVRLGVSPNAEDEDGYTPLHEAASDDNLELLSTLVRLGGQINKVSSEHGWTPLHKACFYNVSTEMLEAMVDDFHADVKVKSKDGKTAMDIARDEGDEGNAAFLDSRMPHAAAAPKKADPPPPVPQPRLSVAPKELPAGDRRGSLTGLAKKKYEYDAFLTHNWGDGQANHKLVSAINDRLKQDGIVTWFDSDRMEGSVEEAMMKGIDRSKVVVAFITKTYIDKVDGDNENDNCKQEFKYAKKKKNGAKGIIPVVMEPECRNPNCELWHGPVEMCLGEALNYYLGPTTAKFSQGDWEKCYQDFLKVLRKRISAVEG